MESGRDRPADRAARLIWRLRSEVEAAKPDESTAPAEVPAAAEVASAADLADVPINGPSRGPTTSADDGSDDGPSASEDALSVQSQTDRSGLPLGVSRETPRDDDEAPPTKEEDRPAVGKTEVEEHTPENATLSEPLARPVTLLTDPATLRSPADADAEAGRTRVVAIANQKGGVGKTTTAVNLGAALAELNQRVLVVDLDPQGNATTGLGVNARNLALSLYDVLIHDALLEDAVEPTAVRNLFLVPAIIDLAGAEIELVPLMSRELRLRKALEPLLEDFDLVLIDCPPSLGLLTINGLAAATEVLVPIQCEYYALEGLDQLLRNVQLVRNALNPNLSLSAIVLTMFDGRTRLAEQVADDVRAHFDDLVCRTVIPRAVRLSEAPSYGQPITIFDPSSRGAIAYRDLAKEVLDVASSRAR